MRMKISTVLDARLLPTSHRLVVAAEGAAVKDPVV